MRLRQVTDLNEAEAIYREHMTVDFPASERQPLPFFVKMVVESANIMYLCEIEGQPAAYAVFREKEGYVLLQYLAVFEGQRGNGTGTRLLREISLLYRDRKGILAEVEHTGYARDEADRRTREKRLAFYERCGYVCLENFDLLLFGEHYQVMVLPLKENRTGDPEYIFGIFREMYCGSPVRNASNVIQWVHFVFNKDIKMYEADAGCVHFVCEKVLDGYETYAARIADGYEENLPRITAFMMEYIASAYGPMGQDELIRSLGAPVVNLDIGVLFYPTHMLREDAGEEHILEIEFSGILEKFIYFSFQAVEREYKAPVPASNKRPEQSNTEVFEALIRDKNVKNPDFSRTALKKEVFYPNILYRDAPAKVRDQLIKRLAQGDENTRHVNGMLMALAAIGDAAVVEAFKKWEEYPPAWSSQLYVGPAEYALEGGWCIEDGFKKELTYEECYGLEMDEECSEEENVFGKTCGDKCPYCSSSYINLLVIDGNDKRLSFLELNGKIKIKTCYSCLPWGNFIYCRYAENGESTVINRTGGSGDPAADESLNHMKPCVISKNAVSKFYSTADRSAIGGAPGFVDDAIYAVCPECGKRMKHLAQVGDDCTGCGTIYVQICKDCKIAATMYQQS